MTVSAQDIEIFNDSLERCNMHPDFLVRFYEIFIASSPEVAEKFKNTNFSKQRRVLKASLYLLIFAAEEKPEGLAHVERMAEIHGPNQMNIPSHMYDLWMESLLQAVKEFDVAYGPRVESAWRNMLQEGVELMKSKA